MTKLGHIVIVFFSHLVETVCGDFSLAWGVCPDRGDTFFNIREFVLAGLIFVVLFTGAYMVHGKCASAE